MRESEAKYKSLYESMMDGFVLVNMEGLIKEYNESYRAMTGYASKELSRLTYHDLTPAKWHEFEQKIIDDQVLERGYSDVYEKEYCRKDGTVFPIELRTFLLRDEQGNNSGMWAIVRDITDRRRAEEELRKSEERLRLVLEANSEGVWDWNIPSGHAVFSPRYSAMLGYEPDEFAKSYISWKDLVHPDDFDRVHKAHMEHIHEDKEFRVELRMRKKSGDWCWILSRGMVVERDAEGNAIRMVGTHLDITERKRTEAELHKSQERFRQVAENVGDFLWEVDANGLYTYTSPSVEKILGFRPHELIGRIHFYDLFTPEAREELKAAVFKLFAAKQPFRAFPNPNLSKDGRVVHVETSGSPMVDEAGNLVGYRGAGSDVTERHNLQSQLQQAEKLESLGTLTGGIAHDFNNILAAMMGFTELVKGKLPKGSKEEQQLQTVMEAGLRGRELVKQMLTFSRQTPQEKKPLLLSSIVKETGKFLRASIPSTIRIETNVQSESGLVLADPIQIQQVLTNLCTNATHAMQEKGGTLDIELSDFSVSPTTGDPHGIAPGLYMRLVVRDSGVGIPREIIDRIFDPFFTTKGLGEGTGLGLSVVMGIIKESQGYITVESEPGKGSTFAVYFPKVAEKQLADATASDEPIPTGTERILFVDDEKPLVQMGEARLAELGYQVTSLASSREALELLKQNPSGFDLVITDQTMPEMTGIELAKHILTLRPQLPVILCTGFSHIVDAEAAKAAGIRVFVMKPLTQGEIARAVRKALDEQKQ